MSQEWVGEWRSDLKRRLEEGWTEEARERAWQTVCQPLPTGDEPPTDMPRQEGLEPPPLSPHLPELAKLAAIGHEFAFELETASSDQPEIQARLDQLRQDHRAWLEQRRLGLEQLGQVARELESLQKRVGAEASIARGAVKYRLERWL